MNAIISIIFISILVIATYGLTVYYDKQDTKKCTMEYVLEKEKGKEIEPEEISLFNIDNLSYLDQF
jgi:hypothetical protein